MNIETPDLAGLVELGRYLRETGYAHIAVTPLTHQYHNDRPGRERAARATRLRDVFGWSLPFAREIMSPLEFDLMRAAGVLSPAPGGLWRSTVRWAEFQGLLCAHSAFPTEEEDAVFFGPDTYRFGRMIRDHLADPSRAARVRRAADLGCGSGAGALLLAEACPEAGIVALDINPKALLLTRANAALAGARNLSTARSDLLDDVEGMFDLLIANPPYMLDAGGRTYRHGGGALGEGLALRIVEEALRRLAPGGTLLLYTGVAIVDGRDPLRAFAERALSARGNSGTYEEIDPDVFSEELLKPAYAKVERIAAVGLTLTRTF